MEITQEQLKTLTGEKCPECSIKGLDIHILPCESCNNTGLPTIEIEKEWVECEPCKETGTQLSNPERFCRVCNGKGKIQKYQVGEEIEVCSNCFMDWRIRNPSGRCDHLYFPEYTLDTAKVIKLKIISETETHQKLQMVR